MSSNEQDVSWALGICFIIFFSFLYYFVGRPMNKWIDENIGVNKQQQQQPKYQPSVPAQLPQPQLIPVPVPMQMPTMPSNTTPTLTQQMLQSNPFADSQIAPPEINFGGNSSRRNRVRCYDLPPAHIDAPGVICEEF